MEEVMIVMAKWTWKFELIGCKFIQTLVGERDVPRERSQK
jgi:hypothetical protein